MGNYQLLQNWDRDPDWGSAESRIDTAREAIGNMGLSEVIYPKFNNQPQDDRDIDAQIIELHTDLKAFQDLSGEEEAK